jgi:hypothetical protein
MPMLLRLGLEPRQQRLFALHPKALCILTRYKSRLNPAQSKHSPDNSEPLIKIHIPRTCTAANKLMLRHGQAR